MSKKKENPKMVEGVDFEVKEDETNTEESVKEEPKKVNAFKRCLTYAKENPKEVAKKGARKVALFGAGLACGLIIGRNSGLDSCEDIASEDYLIDSAEDFEIDEPMAETEAPEE